MGWGVLVVTMMKDSPERDYSRRVRKEKEREKEAKVQQYLMTAKAQAVTRTAATHLHLF